MVNYLHINFYLRKSTRTSAYGAVYVRVTVNRSRITLGAVTVISGLDLPKSIMILCVNWDQTKQRVKPADPQATLINKAITESEQKLRKLYAQHEGFDVRMTSKGVKSCVREGGKMRPSLPDLLAMFLAERTALQTRTSTLDTYRFKFRPLLAFLKQEGTTDQAAEDFTPGTLKRYRAFLITKRGNGERSADKTCQVVKTVLLWAAENEHIQKNPLLNVRIRVDKTPNLECLSQEELALVRDAKLIPALRSVADCFDFACHTGLAYQDMKALTPASIRLVEGSHCIVGKRLKTGTEYCIPISRRVWELMDKYKGIVMPLPKLGDYNPLLRQIMLSLGIEKRITSHTARKTFADWCINELQLSEEATIVAMGQKAAKELTPYRKTRPKRLLSEFPAELLQANPMEPAQGQKVTPFLHIYKAS
ncbi:phage integrase SAM-like domain-containing protein [Spirosoma validum]|uniref:Phage integrase SAM-like domain-containing protein n=1 Tax=Spirosoma validum TaxID=2771355 RepID=A0A927AYB4_9BACT|nr:phage integrase SAM-like domain-containing protein [Spirosoma validum]MBD2752008.1 phage integrase SAM-like domain-containing protein [Spirosoma validum]